MAEELKGNAWVSVSYGGREDDQKNLTNMCEMCFKIHYTINVI